MKTINVALPATYADDALSRSLDIGDIFFEGKKQIVLTCTIEHLKELKSDAEYYVSEAPYMESYLRPIGRSAKRALVKIDKAISELA